MRRLGPSKVAETSGPRPRRVATAVPKVRTGRLLVEEARLLPRAETVLARPLAATSVRVAQPVGVPLRPVGGLLLLGTPPRVGRAGATGVAGHARVAQVGPALDPVIEKASHPATRPVLRPAAGGRPTVAASLPAKAATKMAARVTNHGAVVHRDIVHWDIVHWDISNSCWAPTPKKCRTGAQASDAPIPVLGARKRVCPSCIAPTRTPNGSGTPPVINSAAPSGDINPRAAVRCQAAASWSSATCAVNRVAWVTVRHVLTLVCRSAASSGKICYGVDAPNTTTSTSAPQVFCVSATARSQDAFLWSTTSRRKSTRGHIARYGCVTACKTTFCKAGKKRYHRSVQYVVYHLT